MSHARNRRLFTAAGGLAAAVIAGAALQRSHQRRIASDPEDALLRNPPRGREASVYSPDGTRLHVEVFGPDEATTVVLAHGWTEAIPFWTFVIRDLTERGSE